ncbi:MAG TPA: hypothetical protein DEH22_00825 [Chloroflexi bacterium]|nr:hypothetical protein [Chloroflexota bacterium]
MARYRVVHLRTGETWEVETSLAGEARRVVGWPSELCRVSLKHRGPFADIEPPQIARQIVPPKPGSSHICPDCHITMIENNEKGDFWWQCPSCDLLYHEWENLYYRDDGFKEV